jgi:hypothetical protein
MDGDTLPFDLHTLRRDVERLIVTSAPWQEWFLTVRRVYRWEDPSTTLRWLALYIVCWYNAKMVAFVYGYILYMVIKNRFFPTELTSLRESLGRSAEKGKQALQFAELIEQHGSERWMDPLIDNLGPFVQLQLADIANLIEVLAK